MVKINKFFIPYILFLIAIGFKGHLLVAFLTVVFHESIHYVTARQFGFSGFDIELLPVGAVLSLKDLNEASPRQDLIISLAAPVGNLIVGLLFYVLFTIYQYKLFLLIYISNLIIGLFNLIPALPLDGGRILRDIIQFNTIYKDANDYAVRCSNVIGIILMFYYLYSFFMNKSNFTIGLVAVYIIISSLKERERIVYLIMGDIIKKKYKFLKRGYMENTNISIYSKKDLLTALSIVGKNRYNVFTVLDENMNVLDVIYEDELIKALKDFGNMSIEDFIKIRCKIRK